MLLANLQSRLMLRVDGVDQSWGSRVILHAWVGSCSKECGCDLSSRTLHTGVHQRSTPRPVLCIRICLIGAKDPIEWLIQWQMIIPEGTWSGVRSHSESSSVYFIETKFSRTLCNLANALLIRTDLALLLLCCGSQLWLTVCYILFSGASVFRNTLLVGWGTQAELDRSQACLLCIKSSPLLEQVQFCMH